MIKVDKTVEIGRYCFDSNNWPIKLKSDTNTAKCFQYTVVILVKETNLALCISYCTRMIQNINAKITYGWQC